MTIHPVRACPAVVKNPVQMVLVLLPAATPVARLSTAEMVVVMAAAMAEIDLRRRAAAAAAGRGPAGVKATLTDSACRRSESTSGLRNCKS